MSEDSVSGEVTCITFNRIALFCQNKYIWSQQSCCNLEVVTYCLYVFTLTLGCTAEAMAAMRRRNQSISTSCTNKRNNAKHYYANIALKRVICVP